ncbi:MAG TPA: hypothetical protein VI306_15295 [Pyrinomonadaceae bacterium]
MDNYSNFAEANLSTGYDDNDTALVVATGHGARLPAAPFNAIWYDAAYDRPALDPDVEIVRVTARSSDNLTVVRAQEGTTAADHNTGGHTYILLATLTKKFTQDVAPIDDPTFTTKITSPEIDVSGTGSGAQIFGGADSGAVTLTVEDDAGSASFKFPVSTGNKVLATRDGEGLPVELFFAVGDETTSLTTGTAKLTFRMPFAMVLTSVRASLATASSSGTPTFDINVDGSTILSTKLTIDATEKTSVTAAAAAVISDDDLADDAEITIDIDVAGTGAKGAKIWLIGTRGVASTPPSFDPFEIGFNFRSSSGYVTDGTDETYVRAVDTFPTTRVQTFGWVSTSPSDADRSSGVDRRFAGVNYTQPTEDRTFQLTLPEAGVYAVRLALGDQSASGHVYAEVYDNTTLLFTVADATTSTAVFADSTNAQHALVDWAANNTARVETFASTTFKLKVGLSTQSNYYTIAHLRVTRVG